MNIVHGGVIPSFTDNIAKGMTFLPSEFLPVIYNPNLVANNM